MSYFPDVLERQREYKMRVSAGVAGLFALAVAVAEAFVVPLTTMPAQHRLRTSIFHSSLPPQMSLQGNEKVVVYAGFERIAMTLLKSLGDAPRELK